MDLSRRRFLRLAGLGGLGLAACSLKPDRIEEQPAEDAPTEEAKPAEPEEPSIDLQEFEGLAIDPAAWSYDETHDCYYQLGLPYCVNPGSEQYETLAVYVPGAYFTATKKGSTYACEVNPEAQVGRYTPSTAPVAMPVNSTRYGGQPCPASYSYEGLDRYLEAGLVYVYAGFRGRSGGYESTTQEYFSGGAPWAIADLKAAIRCLRYNAAVLPCDTSRVFVYGYGGGGGYASLVGVSGDASAYDPYLTEIGAATHDVEGAELGDGVYGAALWCPVVSLDSADAAYEWMMGQYANTESRAEGTWTSLLSQDLAAAYGGYLNGLGLVDGDTALTLDRIDDGTFASGTYYDHLLGIVREAASDFLGRTKFPYTETPQLGVEPLFPGDPDLRSSSVAEADREGNEEPAGQTGVHQVQATVYETLESYVSSLNGDNRWLTYNASREEADVAGLWNFIAACRPATRAVCAYDALDRSGTANQLFGTDEETALHFDAMVSTLLANNKERYATGEGWDEGLVATWANDLAKTDALDLTVEERVAMGSQLPYLLAQDGDDTTAIAPHWRLNSGLFQAETTLVSEVNLVQALRGCAAVEDVAFEEVWGAGFGLAERAGDPEDNLVAWIGACCPEPEENE